MNIRSFIQNCLTCLLFITAGLQHANAQYVYKIKADTVRIYNSCDTAELVLQNRTQNVLGFLYNKGGGVTEFRALNTIDSVYKSNDTLYYRLASGQWLPVKIGQTGSANTIYTGDGSITGTRVVAGDSTGKLAWNNFSSIQSTLNGPTQSTKQAASPGYINQWVQNANVGAGYGFSRAGLRIDTTSGIVLGDDPETNTVSSKAGRIGIDKTGIYFTKSMNNSAHEMRDSSWFWVNSDTTKITTLKTFVNSSVIITQNAPVSRPSGPGNSAGTAFSVTGGLGGTTKGASNGGSGGTILMTGGKGGPATDTTSTGGGLGGTISITGGAGGDNPNMNGRIGAGGNVTITGGAAGAGASSFTSNRGGRVKIKGGGNPQGMYDVDHATGWLDLEGGDATTGYGGNVVIAGGAGSVHTGDVYLGAYNSDLGVGYLRGHVYAGFTPPVPPDESNAQIAASKFAVGGLAYANSYCVGMDSANVNYSDIYGKGIVKLGQITANHTVDFSTASLTAGQLLWIHVANTSSFSWSITGSITAKLPNGTALTTLANGTLYSGYFDGTNIILKP